MLTDPTPNVNASPPFLHDELIPLREIGKTLGSPNLCYATAWRWALRGVRGIILPTLKIGRVRYVRRSDLLAFGEALAEKAAADYATRTPAPVVPNPASRGRSAATRERDLQAAKDRLRKRGLLSA